MKTGFTILEMLAVITILAILGAILVGSLSVFNKSQALSLDVEQVMSVIEQARNQTLTSKGGSQYGVHFEATRFILFAGSTYSAQDPNNQIFMLNPLNTVQSVTFTGGGTNVIFTRLTGDTLQNGSIVLSSASLGKTKTVTIHKTGLIEAN